MAMFVEIVRFRRRNWRRLPRVPMQVEGGLIRSGPCDWTLFCKLRSFLSEYHRLDTASERNQYNQIRYPSHWTGSSYK
ncbi:uncharacterized protein LOC111259227 isoform X3 [Varroa jacobsoni]|uniref:uncharacterized protein LOC111259227 isoform X3 n=1 Tax=Varroa jacobsoni TaxID=62625 RepID=UPI000BF7C6DB|nr:uncharacterized protein LOC111259227 isoform X3 [Varroa jacobsoni]